MFYTPGGSPIFWPTPKSLRPRRKRNVRLACTACPHKTTRNQAKNTKGHCLYCKAPLKAATQPKGP